MIDGETIGDVREATELYRVHGDGMKKGVAWRLNDEGEG